MEIEENCERFVASTKRKFLSLLNKLAGQSDFTAMELYGGFKYQPYSLEAFSTVLIAKRP
ncbi:MAG: hypothetical protein V3S65_00980 [Candidatus Aminicenantaceae bacterium]